MDIRLLFLVVFLFGCGGGEKVTVTPSPSELEVAFSDLETELNRLADVLSSTYQSNSGIGDAEASRCVGRMESIAKKLNKIEVPSKEKCQELMDKHETQMDVDGFRIQAETKRLKAAGIQLESLQKLDGLFPVLGKAINRFSSIPPP